jgi:hypothetical protein
MAGAMFENLGDPHEVTEFFSIDIIFPAALGPGVYSTSNRMTTIKE